MPSYLGWVIETRSLLPRSMAKTVLLGCCSTVPEMAPPSQTINRAAPAMVGASRSKMPPSTMMFPGPRTLQPCSLPGAPTGAAVEPYRSFHGREDLHLRPDLVHARGADENGVGGPVEPAEVDIGFERVDLAAEGVAAHGHVDAALDQLEVEARARELDAT